MFNKYYQEELSFLRDLGKEFSRAHPAAAHFLSEAGSDPDVERMIEGFAFLTGRIREKLDDELPEVTGTFLNLLWPHYLLWSGSSPGVLGAAWEEMAVIPGNNTLEAMREAVGRHRGTSLEDEVRAFRIWNVFLGEFDDGNHYPFASDLPGHTLSTDRRDQIFQIGVRLGYDSRDAWGDPHRGWLDQVEIRKTGGLLPGDGDFRFR